MTEILDADGITFDLSTDCVVIGAGACGVIAALALADAGVEALILERDAKPAGSTSMSSGFIPAASTRLQQSQGIDDSPERFVADIQKKAQGQANSDVVRAVTESIGPTLDWLEQTHGIQWVLLNDFLYPGHSAHRMHCVPEKTGAALLDRLLSAARAVDVDIACNALVDALLVNARTEDSRSACGVRVKRPDGSHEYIKSTSVILACNGYGANDALRERFIPEMVSAHYYGHAGNTGDAILWGEQLDVPLVHTGAYQGHGSLAAGHNILITWALMMEGGIQVNVNGQRFSNEHAGYSEQAVNVLDQPGSVVWNIYDQRLHDLGMGFPDYRDANQVGAVYNAADVSSLAKCTGLPEEPLCNTLSAIAQLASANKTDEFGREFTAGRSLKPPYYAIKVAAAIFHTQGGLAIDKQARVLTSSGSPLANLYAAGGAACGVSGSSVAGYLSGNGLLTAVALGKIAADTVIRSHNQHIESWT